MLSDTPVVAYPVITKFPPLLRSQLLHTIIVIQLKMQFYRNFNVFDAFILFEGTNI